ncbi:MAG: hypothetical protein U9Q82_15165 [Chloroflexota bacterium]|nr:hypothetical protein [Chloroflexota bacterium]
MASFDSPQNEYDNYVRDGINAAKNGSNRLARRLLESATRMRAGDARPWLWLAKITADPDEKRDCLEEAVAIEPGNAAARRELALLTGKIQPEDLLPQVESVQAF